MARSEISYTWLRQKKVITVKSIEWLQCQDKVTVAHTVDGREHLLDADTSHSVTALVKEFPDVFIMVRRGLALAFEQIDMITNGSGKYAGLKKIHLFSGAMFYASRRTGREVAKRVYEWREARNQNAAAQAPSLEKRELERAATITVPPSAGLKAPIQA